MLSIVGLRYTKILENKKKKYKSLVGTRNALRHKGKVRFFSRLDSYAGGLKSV